MRKAIEFIHAGVTYQITPDDYQRNEWAINTHDSGRGELDSVRVSDKGTWRSFAGECGDTAAAARCIAIAQAALAAGLIRTYTSAELQAEKAAKLAARKAARRAPATDREGMYAGTSERQAYRRANGQYNRVNPCNVCGTSAGVDYCSDRRTDSTDSAGNNWADIALVLCGRCAEKLDAMPDAEAYQYMLTHRAPAW